MNLNEWLRAIAGFFVLLSVVLAVTVDQRFLWFTGFVGLNLMARNTGYTEFKGNGRQPNLSSFNGIAHLDTVERRELITYA